MRKLKSIILTLLALAVTIDLHAQAITSVHGTVSDDLEPLIGAARLMPTDVS